MYCRNCGTQLPDGTNFCTNCGTQQSDLRTDYPTRPLARPSSHMALAILTTIICFFPFGIVAVYYAAKVDSAWDEGNFEAAEHYSKRSRNWSIAAIVIGIIWIFLVLLFYGILAGAFIGILSDVSMTC